jgi:hypothetical protein
MARLIPAGPGFEWFRRGFGHDEQKNPEVLYAPAWSTNDTSH